MEREVITESQAASYLGISPKTLQRLRVKGKGPPYLRIGTTIRYRKARLVEWLDNREFSSTADEFVRAQQ